MAIVTPDVGEANLLNLLNTAWTTLTIHLFKNNVTPDSSSTNSSFSEADFSGYSSDSLTSGAVTTVSNKARLLWDDVSFVKSGATSNTIYGYWVKKGSTYWYAEKFASSVVLTNDDDSLTVTPKFTLSSDA